jgi:tetrahydromethanopterin S-methyltransferase subunit G
MPLTEINHTLETFHDLIVEMGTKLDEETRARRKSIGILYGVIIGVVVLALLAAGGFLLIRQSEDANKHDQAVKVCLTTNANRDALRSVIAKQTQVEESTLRDVSGILALAGAPTPGETDAQKQAVTAFLATANQSITATINTAEQAATALNGQFKDSDCTKVK